MVPQTAHHAQGNIGVNTFMNISVQGPVSSALLTSYPPLFRRLCLILHRYTCVLRVEILRSALKLLGTVHLLESSSRNLHCLLTGALSLFLRFSHCGTFFKPCPLLVLILLRGGFSFEAHLSIQPIGSILIKPHVRATAIIEHLPTIWLMFYLPHGTWTHTEYGHRG